MSDSVARALPGQSRPGPAHCLVMVFPSITGNPQGGSLGSIPAFSLDPKYPNGPSIVGGVLWLGWASPGPGAECEGTALRC